MKEEYFKIVKLKKDTLAVDTGETIKAGTRVLIYFDGETCYMPITKEITQEEIEKDEFFTVLAYNDIIYTKKGNKVIVYKNIETGERYFKLCK